MIRGRDLPKKCGPESCLVTRVCALPGCGQTFRVFQSEIKRGANRGRYCSRACVVASRSHAHAPLHCIVCKKRRGKAARGVGMCRDCASAARIGRQRTRKTYDTPAIPSKAQLWADHPTSWWAAPQTWDDFTKAQHANEHRMQSQARLTRVRKEPD